MSDKKKIFLMIIDSITLKLFFCIISIRTKTGIPFNNLKLSSEIYLKHFPLGPTFINTFVCVCVCVSNALFFVTQTNTKQGLEIIFFYE